MSNNSHDHFEAFWNLVSESEHKVETSDDDHNKEISQTLAGLDPIEKQSLLKKSQESVAYDQELLLLHDDMLRFQGSTMGDGPFIAAGHAFRIRFEKICNRFLTQGISDGDVIQIISRELYVALNAQKKLWFIQRKLTDNEAALAEYRIAKLEKGLSKANQKTSDFAKTEFTTTQQMLALRYLLRFGFNVSPDDVRVVDLAHLLSAKPIPMKDGKRNPGNSSLRTALVKASSKSTKGQLADLRFISSILRPLAGEGSNGISDTLRHLDLEIATLKSKIKSPK